MLETRIVYLNGEFVAWQQATVHIMCHSFGRGSAIFEVISFHATDSGPVIFRLEEHIKRLFKTAELLDMKLPLSPAEFCQAAAETVKRNQLNQGFIKIICYYPQFSVQVLPPQSTTGCLHLCPRSGPGFSGRIQEGTLSNGRYQ